MNPEEEERKQKIEHKNAMERIAFGFVIGAVVASIVAVSIGVGVFMYDGGTVLFDIEDIKREQYYRGLYDTCVLVLIQVYKYPMDMAQRFCIADLPKAIEGDWYSEESPGWTWPLEE